MREIDLATWNRRKPYELFRASASPHFGVTADIDITRFINDIKPTGLSVFNAILFAIMKAVNSIPEFRTRFSGDKVYEYSVTHPSFTVPIEETQFAFCESQYSADWAEFNYLCNEAKEQARQQTQLEESTVTDQWTYLTCAPWMHFTAMTHAHNGVEDCIPRIAWGKYTKRGDRWLMPLNVQAHHAIMDGYHVAKMFELTEKILREEPFK
ncbi:MAG: chloramphenicol acetyltransferase [Sneathiella sp.]|nr:chloramphenicol acetyltransferase [Sneathiella sp.]